MAFKILNADEIELLTEKQRESYEKELEVYNARVKFVEQMEQMENAVVTPYEMKRVTIASVDKAPDSEFEAPEYVVTKIDPIAKPESKVESIIFKQLSEPMIPEHRPIEKVSIEPMKEVESCNPVLPEVMIDSAPKHSSIDAKSLDYVKKIEQGESILPEVSVTAAPKYSSIDTLSLDFVKKMEQGESILPEVSVTAAPKYSSIDTLSLDFAKKMEQGESILPEVMVTTAPKYSSIDTLSLDFVKKMEQGESIVPEVMVTTAPKFTELKSVSLDQMKDVKECKPDLISIPSQEFHELEPINPMLPVTEKPESFTELEFSSLVLEDMMIKDETPKYKAPVMKFSEFKAPENSTPVLPKTLVDVPEALAVNMPKQADPVLPKASALTAVNVSFKQVNKPMAKLPKVSDKCIVNASFNKPDMKEVQLPATSKVGIPVEKFVRPEQVLSVLPSVSIPKAEIQSYKKPNVDVQQHKISPVYKPEIVVASEFKPMIDHEPKITYPTINMTSVETLKKPIKITSGSVSAIPDIQPVVIPDTYEIEEIKKLLLADEEIGTDKGALA